MRRVGRAKVSSSQKPVSKRGSARRARSFLRQIIAVSGIAVFLCLCAIGVGLYHANKPEGFFRKWLVEQEASLWQFTAEYGLTLQYIYVEGKRHTPGDVLVSALGIKIGQPILAISPRKIKAQIEQIDWVRYATVERQLPNTLRIKIVERQPLAIWQKAGKLYLVDEEGQMIEEKNLKAFSRLLIMIGDDAPFYARDLLKIIKEDPELYKEIAAAIRVGERRWNIRFTSGLEIKLPEDNVQSAWDYVLKCYHDNKLFGTDITSIDLRIADRLYLDTAPLEEKRGK